MWCMILAWKMGRSWTCRLIGKLDGLHSVGRIRNDKSAGALAPIGGIASVAVQNQDGEFGIGCKRRDPNGLATQYPLGVACRVPPAPKPHHLWRRAGCCCEFVEIGVRGHDDEVAGFGELPYVAIRAFKQAGLRNMCRTGV